MNGDCLLNFFLSVQDTKSKTYFLQNSHINSEKNLVKNKNRTDVLTEKNTSGQQVHEKGTRHY